MTRAIGGLWWGSNKPGGFLLARVLESRRVYVIAEVKIARVTLPEAVQKIRDLADVHECALGTVYADDVFFDDGDTKKKAIRTPSIAHRLRQHHLAMAPIAGEHAHGWQLIRDYMRVADDGLPWLVIDPRCKETTRTLGAVIQSKNDADEASGPLHMAHALRCILSSQPAPEIRVEKPQTIEPWTIAEMDAHDRRAKRPGLFGQALPGSRVMYGR